MDSPTTRPTALLQPTSHSIDWRSTSSLWTWQTDTAMSLIDGYGRASQSYTKRRTHFQAMVLSRIGNGMLLNDRRLQQHDLMKDPEPLKTKPRFDPFGDEPCNDGQPTFCPKMTEFLLTESFNPNPFPNHGQWDEDKAMLPTHKPRVAHLASRGNATDEGPTIYQPRPVSCKDYGEMLRNILEFEFNAAEDDGVNGAYDGAADEIKALVPSLNSLGLNFAYDEADANSDGYSSDGGDCFDVPSATSSTDTTPAKAEVLLKVSPFDVERLTSMDARGQLQDFKGLGLPTPEFMPAPLKEGTTAFDLLMAIQAGSDLPFQTQSPTEDFKPTPFEENTTAQDLLKAIQVGRGLPFLAPTHGGKQQKASPIPRSAYPPTPLIGEPVSLPASATSLFFPNLDEGAIDEGSPLAPFFP